MRYQSEDFIFLRIPRYNSGLINKAVPSKKDYLKLIQDTIDKKEFQEALSLSSQVLYKQIYSEKITKLELTEKMQQSVFNYLVRMCSKSTPYGLFSGYSIAHLDRKSDFIIDNNITVYCSLDFEVIYGIVNNILQNTGIWNTSWRYYPNDTLYELNDKYYFLEYKIIHGIRSYELTSVDKNEYLEKIFDYSKNGLALSDILTLLDDEDIEDEEKREFIEEIVNCQLLQSDLLPSLSGADPLMTLLPKLETSLSNDYVKRTYNELLSMCEILKMDISITNKNKLIREILDRKFPGNYKQCLRVDYRVNTLSDKISSQIIQELSSDFGKLYSILPKSKIRDLEDFKHRFSKKFGDKMVKLPLALDSVHGIGYGDQGKIPTSVNPIVHDIIAADNSSSEDKKISLNVLQTIVVKKMFEQKQSCIDEINIEEGDIEKIRQGMAYLEEGFPSSVYAMGTLLKLDSDNFTDPVFVLDAMYGPTSAKLMTRFSINDEKLYAQLLKICKSEEEDSSHIIAEIVHSPQERMGNIILRPSLRTYEIPYLGKSDLPGSNQISINDLFIRVYKGKLELWSKNHKKKVLPRLTNAHAFGKMSLPIYKFLCDIQYEDIRGGFSWDWGDLSESSFLPRVLFRGIVLSRKTWRIEKNDLIPAHLNKKSFSDLYPVFKTNLFQCIDQKGMGTLFYLLTNEGKVIVNCENYGSLSFLFSFIRNRSVFVVQEVLQMELGSLKDKEGNTYFNEAIIPLRSMVGKSKQESFPGLIPESIKRADFIREWLFVKIYLSPLNGEKFLLNPFRGFVQDLHHDDEEVKFFFIKYHDPDHHLRIRFKINNSEKVRSRIEQKISKSLAPLLVSGEVQSLSFETYERELERYGPNIIENIEELFCLDSNCTFLNLYSLSSIDEKEKLVYMCKVVDVYMGLFFVDWTDREKLIEIMFDSFYKEFGGTKGIKVTLDTKFREYRRLLEETFVDPESKDSNIYQTLHHFISDAEPIVKSIISKIETKSRLYHVVFSMIHMAMNRLSSGLARKHELIVYYFVYKYYKSYRKRSLIQ